MKRSTKGAIVGAILALLGLGALGSAGTGGLRPRPNLPPGKGGRSPHRGGGTPPDELEPDGLWISPDCTEVREGPQWFAQVAMPAIDAWVADGYGRRLERFNPNLSAFRVVREILSPYAPLCIERAWWPDVFFARNPAPQDEAGQNALFGEADRAADAAKSEAPALWGLIDRVYGAVRDAADAAYPGDPFGEVPGL